MSDPAVEAAQRALPMFASNTPHQSMIDAAREALAPLRELHRNVDEWGEPVCAYCMGHDGWHLDWPCDTARLIYPSEDL